LKQICQYEDESQVPSEIINEYKLISSAIIEYEAAYHPLPGRVSTIITDEIVKRMTEKHLKQKNVAQILGISESRISDLLNGKRPLNLRIVKRLRDELNIPADFILNHC
jgi:antitoxin component HigA of HigAB toxin-antitoxin module